MSIQTMKVIISCDGNRVWNKDTSDFDYIGCKSNLNLLEVQYKYFPEFEFGRSLEENIGMLFKTYHHKLDEVYEDKLNETPPELDGWTFETDGILCDYVRCPECSKFEEEE